MQSHHYMLNTIQIKTFPDGRMDTENAALYLGLAIKTLAMMRSAHGGPKFIKRGRVFYYKDDLDNWLNEFGKYTSNKECKTNRLIEKELI